MRRSSRISARTTTVKDDSARVAACGPAPSPSLNQPSCKRRKTSQQTQASSSTTKSLQTLYGARRKGKLAALSEMPVDIIYEICSKLHPRDLLQVSRTTKIWRDMLMNKKRSEGIWRNSYIGTEGLPPLPEDIPIPKFVGLLFDRLCHFCNASVSRNIIWIARVRACNKCLQNLDLFHSQYMAFIELSYLPGEVHFTFGLPRLIPSTAMGGEAFRRTGYDRVYPAALVAAYMADHKSSSVHTLNEEEQLRWCGNRAKEADAFIQHSTLCEAWEEEHQSDRSSELQRLREERYTEIVRRLTELGFGDEIQKAGDGFLNHKLVKKPQRLSEKVWRNIKDPLISYLQDLKTNRIRRERDGVIDTRKRLVSDLYKKYLSTQPFTAILPCVGEILTHPEISLLVKGTPLDHEVTKDTLRVALEGIPESYYSSWRARYDDALVKILGANAPATRADLSLATTAFDLNEELTMDTLSYPHVLVASTITGAYNGLHNLNSRTWSAHGLRVARGYRAIAEQVITLVGLDPKTTTAQEMDEQGAWFLWTGEAKKLVVNWRGACRLEHYANCQSAKKLRIKLLTPKDTELVRDKYARDVYRGGALAEKVQCVRCEARLKGGSAMRSHLAKWHNISTPTRADYVLSPQVEGGVGIYKWPLMSDEDDGQGSLFRVYNFKGLY